MSMKSGQFVLCKNATAKREKYVGGCGDCYCFTAIERKTKLIVAWHMGKRNEPHTDKFIAKLAKATTGRLPFSSRWFQVLPIDDPQASWRPRRPRNMVKIYREARQQDRRALLASQDNRMPSAPAYSACRNARSICTSPRRAPQRLNSLLHQADGPADLLLLKTLGEPSGGPGSVLRPLQFLPEAQNLERPHPGDGPRTATEVRSVGKELIQRVT